MKGTQVTRQQEPKSDVEQSPAQGDGRSREAAAWCSGCELPCTLRQDCGAVRTAPKQSRSPPRHVFFGLSAGTPPDATTMTLGASME
jgi:hypothetical protein